ncbi:hypothetical protein KRX57_06045 [Weeksellaceae bacterium TAE3-ERU29]|nr:hypothetical protein [Weeksellaceae bacterium TAE3-ERU29]
MKNYKLIDKSFFGYLDRKGTLEKLINEYSYNKDLVFSDNNWSEDFQVYLFLTHLEHKNLSINEVYINRYYWFKKFYYDYSKINGYDTGIEQQIGILLDDMANDVSNNFDWEIIEKIDNQFKTEV